MLHNKAKPSFFKVFFTGGSSYEYSLLLSIQNKLICVKGSNGLVIKELTKSITAELDKFAFLK